MSCVTVPPTLLASQTSPEASIATTNGFGTLGDSEQLRLCLPDPLMANDEKVAQEFDARHGRLPS